MRAIPLSAGVIGRVGAGGVGLIGRVGAGGAGAAAGACSLDNLSCFCLDHLSCAALARLIKNNQ